MTPEQRIAIEAALSISYDIEKNRHDGSYLNLASVRALHDLLAETSGKQEAVSHLSKWSKVIREMPDTYAAPPAKSAEQDRIDAARWRMAKKYGYVSDNEELRIDSYIENGDAKND